MKKKEKDAIALVKTDYDNFKDLSFFMDQQRKAEAMLREVEEFKKSFVMSKMFSAKEFFKQNPCHSLIFFKPDRLCLEYDDNDKLESMYIIMDTGNFLAPQGKKPMFQELYHQNLDPYSDIYKKLPEEKKEFLDDFYKNIFFSRYHIKKNELFLQEYDEDKGQYDVKYDESCTLYLIDDCEKYINTEFIEKAKERYIKKESKGYKKGCAPKVKYFQFYYTVYDGDDYRDLFKVDELINYFEKRRFKDQVEFLKSLYVANTDEMAYWWKKKSYHHFSPDLDKKSFVLYKDELVWVTNHPDKVQITTSDDKKSIICEFKDKTEYATYCCPSDGPRIVDTRIMQLKYSTKDNELKKVEERHDTYEYQPKRRY